MISCDRLAARMGLPSTSNRARQEHPVHRYIVSLFGSVRLRRQACHVAAMSESPGPGGRQDSEKLGEHGGEIFSRQSLLLMGVVVFATLLVTVLSSPDPNYQSGLWQLDSSQSSLVIE